MLFRLILCGAVLSGHASFLAAGPDDEALYADAVNELASADRLREYHDLLASEPHVAGSIGDQRTIERIAALFASFGLHVETQEFWAYLAVQGRSTVEVHAGDDETVTLPLREKPVDSDPDTQDPHLGDGWSAYSGSGDVIGEVVYANYGRLEDFTELNRLGIDCRGKIVIARFGGNYRGFKAKYAQEAGAIGLVIYTDPADSGYTRGIPYPDGGWANETSIQRGSLATLDYPGDPLTPFIAATEGAERLDPESVALPRIPVQPIGWGAAHEILSRMSGQRVPDAWQGGLPFSYRLEGGAALRVRVSVEQTRKLVKSANVIGEIRGSTHPDEVVIVGCHHDSWGHGASDPLAGLICLIESARCFGELASQGWKPARTIRFAAWGAEEHGIIGSVEYVEAHAQSLAQGAIAYINLDMAAMGQNFGASGTPSLAAVIGTAAASTPQANAPEQTVLDHWSTRSNNQPNLGDLGGGSDHIGFLCHLCIPSVSLGAHGSPGTSYHSNYDTLAWYRKVVGEDYESALMITRITNGTVARLAHARVLPFEPTRYTDATLRHIANLRRLVATSASLAPIAPPTLDRIASEAEAFKVLADAVMARVAIADVPPDRASMINQRLIDIERLWCTVGFDTGRSWFRNGYAAPDQTSGYAAWMLPALRHAVELGDPDLVTQRGQSYIRFFERSHELIGEINLLIE